MFYLIWEDEQSLHIQSSYPKLFSILGTNWVAYIIFQINFACNPATSADH